MKTYPSIPLRHARILPAIPAASPLFRRRSLLLSVIALACLTLPQTAHSQADNTAYGSFALYSSPTGSFNSAFGVYALFADKDGSNNTGVGFQALFSNASGSRNTVVGSLALKYNEQSDNTAIGCGALLSNFSGTQNTAVGSSALYGTNGASGSYNTAIGFQSLRQNTTGNYNIASGFEALYSDTTGGANTASGAGALRSNTIADYNTADGANALYSNTEGYYNTASGADALYSNIKGNYNTALGMFALYSSTGGSNVAVGYQAGKNLTVGSNNIVIGAGLLGTAGESNTTRIGKTTQAKTLIGGIYGKTVASASGVAVRIDSTGKLGTVLSSARYKEAIKPMDKASEAILQLEPVTFRYKKDLDPDGVQQFGLIAEQVEKVNPDLVVRDEDGKVSTVRYEAVNAMLLNEFLKEHRKVEDQQATIREMKSAIAQQQQEIKALTASLKEQAATIQKVGAQITTNQGAPGSLATN
jgi:hypothetical protein